jgi:hypothetical protein
MPPFILNETDIIGLIRPSVDAHSLGISTVANLLEDCGYKVIIGDAAVALAVAKISKLDNIDFFSHWIALHRITVIGFSYRLDPQQAQINFGKVLYHLKSRNMLKENGGTIRKVFFAGLPEACQLIKREYEGEVEVFVGDETPVETLKKLGVSESKIPASVIEGSAYDDQRWEFAKSLIANKKYLTVQPANRSGYPGFGTFDDNIMNRITHANSKGQHPLMRVHVGPYNPNYKEAVKEFTSWVRQLANDGFLDIVSIGSSQLTQSNFGEDWKDLPNGGGVPVNSAAEYRMLWEAGRPMLFRTYAGTKNIPRLARIHELSLNICWHALSFWWFCQIDGRGPYTVLENLKQHYETLKFIAESGKPFEPNIPHHFAFRGGDDVTYVVSSFLAAKTAKKLGVKYFVLQNMLNTPKSTWGVQDLAKSRVLLKLIRSLEDSSFKVYLQPRAGLDYFSPDLEKAKIQLASVTALMDDIDPHNHFSPDMIHVVSYSEASHLANPDIIKESIQITIEALKQYRELRQQKKIEDMTKHQDTIERTDALYAEAIEMIKAMENNIPDLYTPQGLYKAFAAGFLIVPYLWEGRDEFKNAIKWKTALVKGAIKIVDENGIPVTAIKRIPLILNDLSKF